MSTKLSYVLLAMAVVIATFALGYALGGSINAPHVFEVAYEPPQVIQVVVSCDCCCQECPTIVPEIRELEETDYTISPTASPTEPPKEPPTVTPTPSPTDTPTPPPPTVTPTPEPTKKAHCDKGKGNGGEGCDPGKHPENGNDDEASFIDFLFSLS